MSLLSIYFFFLFYDILAPSYFNNDIRLIAKIIPEFCVGKEKINKKTYRVGFDYAGIVYRQIVKRICYWFKCGFD